MASIKDRKSLRIVNQFQINLMILVFFPIILILLGSYVTIDFFINETLRNLMGLHSSQVTDFFYQWRVCIVIFLWSVFLGFVLFCFDYAHKLFGAYHRVIQELDEVLAGKRTEKIVVRKYDVLFIDIMERVNVLIESYAQQRSKTGNAPH